MTWGREDAEHETRVRRPVEPDRGVRSAPGCAACSKRVARTRERLEREQRRHGVGRDAVVAEVELVIVGGLAAIVRDLASATERSIPAVLRGLVLAELERLERDGDGPAFTAAAAALRTPTTKDPRP